MHCSSTSTRVPAMLSNFKKRFRNAHPEQQPFLSQQPDASSTDSPEHMDVAQQQQHWAAAMADTVYVPGCTCTLCIMRSETESVTEPQRHDASRSLPSFRSIMEVLYPPPHPDAPSPFPDPPSYSQSDSIAYLARVDNPEVSPLISSAPTNIARTPLLHNRSDPLFQDPSLTGVPSQETVSERVTLVEPNPPIVGFDSDVPEEPLPAYTRFDQRRPRFPTASDILGPYPPMSVIRQSAQ